MDTVITSIEESNPAPDPPQISLSRRRSRISDTAPRSQSRPRRAPLRLDVRTAFRDFSGVVEVIVGDEKDRHRPQSTFLVHKELLVAASPFFAAALGGNFLESLSQTVRLPEEKPEIFEWFLQWLYTGQLNVPKRYTPVMDARFAEAYLNAGHAPTGTRNIHGLEWDSIEADGALRNTTGSPKYFVLIDLWALSDRLLTTQLSNHILDTVARLSHTTNSVPTPSDTFMLYDNTRDSSPLRKLILDLFAWKQTDKLLETHKDDWHPRFLRDLVVKLKRPDTDTAERHELFPIRLRNSIRTCEGCKEPLKANFTYEQCVACRKLFCDDCLRSGESIVYTDMTGCKPWLGRNLCLRYHEHDDPEVCF